MRHSKARTYALVSTSALRAELALIMCMRMHTRSTCYHTRVMVSKRKCSVLNLEKKTKVIADIRAGKSQRFVGETDGVPKSTVADIWEEREKIEASSNPTFIKKCCIVREAHFQNLDEACYIWFQQKRAKGAPVSGSVLQEKSQQLFSSLYPDEDKATFKASSGWPHKFCNGMELENYFFRAGHYQLTLQLWNCLPPIANKYGD